MWMHWFGDTRQPCRFPAYLKNGVARDGASQFSARKEPLGRPLPAPVSSQYFEEGVRKHDLAILASLAAANPDNLTVAIEIAYLQVGHFRYPESRPIHGGQNRPVAEVLRGYQQSFYLRFAKDDGKLLLIPGQRNPLDLDLAVQRVAVEKAETADGLYVGRELDSLLIEQEQLPRADFFRTQTFGRLIEVLGELGDRADVAFHGRWSVIANAEI